MGTGWKDIWEAYPHLFEGEATTTANVGVYERPLGPMLKPPGYPSEGEIPDAYLEILGLKEWPK